MGFVIGLQGPEKPQRGRLCNAVMAAKPGCAFVHDWLDAYEEHFNPDGWGEASVDLPYLLHEKLGDDYCTVVPTSRFLWPSWNELHNIFVDNQEIPGELITLHLWGTISGPFLGTIRDFAWAAENSETLYGRCLLRICDLAKAAGPP